MTAPRPGRWLLHLTLPSDPVGRSILGDLEEEYRQRVERDGPLRAWAWFNGQAMGVSWRQAAVAGVQQWRGLTGGDAMRDLGFALKALRAYPAVNVTVALVVGLGVAGTALAFSLVDQALVRSLPYAAPEGLYQFRHTSAETGADQGQLSPRDLEDLRSELGWERQLTSYFFDPVSSVATLAGQGTPVGVTYAAVDEAFFTVLGVQPTMGRALGQADNVPGKDAVVVVSHDLWLSQLGGAPDIVGESLRLDDALFEVVGVMPSSFQFPAATSQLWMPASRITEDMIPDRRGVRYREALLRVPLSSTAEEAQLAAEVVMARLAEAYPATNEGWTRAELVPLRDALVGGFRSGLLFLMATTVLLLLVVAASVAGLITARTSARTRELAIRLSVGADRARLARQLMLESVVLAVVGGAGGLGLAWLAADAASGFASSTLGYSATVTPDLRVAVFTAAVSVLTGIAFGVVPAFSVLRAEPNAFLGGARGGVGRMKKGLRTLVLAETALATLLLAGTGLMTRSFQNLVRTDPGFEAENVWSLQFQIAGDDGPVGLVRDRQRLTELARDVPGVVSVGGSKTPLLEGGGEPYDFTVAGATGEPIVVTPESGAYFVLPGFFETLGARFVTGRPFTDDDPRLSVVVNRTIADNLWPAQDPLGKELHLGSNVLPVIGVVESLHDDGLTGGAPGAVYVNAINFPRTAFFMFVRTAPGAADAVAAVEEAIWAEFPDQAILATTRVTDLLAEEVAGPRWLARVIGTFGALALLLAGLGVYGVVAQATENRRGEIAIRIALGAAPRRVLREQLTDGTSVILIGTAVGLVAALGLGRLLASLLFGVAPHDAIAFTGAGLLVLASGLVASLIPALRAARIDPVHIIREE